MPRQYGIVGVESKLAATELLFTWPAPFSLAAPPGDACNNTDALLSEDTQECSEALTRTGITCGSAQCGRPEDWPEGEPFFLPINMHNADQWVEFGLGLGQARADTGGKRRLSDAEITQLQVRARALAARGDRRVGAARYVVADQTAHGCWQHCCTHCAHGRNPERLSFSAHHEQ